MHSYQHNIKTFNSATMHLTHVERSLYRCLIELYYDTEQPLPAGDFDRLAKRVLAFSEEEKTALKYVLGEFFTLTGDVYTHDYCDEVIDNYHRQNSAKARAGKASAAARKKRADERKNKRATKSQQNLTGVEQVLDSVPTGVRNHKPLTINHKPILKTYSSPNGDSSPGDENSENPKPVEQEITDQPDQPKTPACPHRDIIALYNEILPELQAVIPERWEGTARAKDLAARWRESPKHQTLAFWKRYFTFLKNYPFYLGENDRGWRANLEWLVKRRNFDNLLEKFRSDTPLRAVQ